MKKLEKLILIMSLFFVFILVYSPHFSYKYPLHADEYQHIAKAVNFLETKNLNVNPYFFNQPYYLNIEPGFTLFLASLIKLGFNPIASYRFLPAIFATLSAFILFYLIFYLTKNFYTSTFSILFFAGLKSNVNLGGLWFFTPLTLVIPLIFLALFLFFRWYEKKDNTLLILSIFVLLIIFLIHPISTILVYALIFLFLIFNKDIKKVILSGFVPVILFFIILILWKGPYPNLFIWIFDWLILEEGWGYVEINYFLPLFYNIIPFILGLIGMYPAIKNSRLRLFVIWFFLMGFLIFIFNNFKFSILFPYQRLIYYILLSLIPLSSLGLSFVIKNIKKPKFIPVILVIVVFVFTFYNYYDIPNKSQLYNVIDDNDYNALKFLGQFSPSIVMAPLPQSTAVYPISKNHVIGMTQSNLRGGDSEKVIEFYENSCDRKEEIAKKYKIKYVLSKDRLNCNFLKEVYNEGDFIYEI